MPLRFSENILDDTIALINLSREGLAYPIFHSIVGYGPFSLKEWSLFLHISERTLQRYKKEGRRR